MIEASGAKIVQKLTGYGIVRRADNGGWSYLDRVFGSWTWLTVPRVGIDYAEESEARRRAWSFSGPDAAARETGVVVS